VAEAARRALALATFAVGAVVATRAGAAEPPRAAAATPPSSHANAPKSNAAAADLELLEFLGSDDVEPEFQDYLANHAPAGTPAAGRSEKK
jgi:hypothetical protein